MAIVTSMWLRGSRKRLGGTVIYQAMGQTRQRELAPEVSNPRTVSQQTQRVKWSNLVNLYRANQSWMKYAFETKKVTQSEYNKFMSLNVASSNIYLPKHVANAGGCVVAPYYFTQGSLPSIEWVKDAGVGFTSNIVLSSGYEFMGPLVSEFSQTLIDNNPGIRQGDQLSIIRMTQMSNADTGVPYVIVRKYELIVDVNNVSEHVTDYWPADMVDSNEAEDARLIIRNTNKSGGFAMILSRTISGKTYVSTQRVVIMNNEAMIANYSSPAALQAAIDSYGVQDDAFLSSTTAEGESQAPTPLSLLSAQYEQESVIAAGARFAIDEVEEQSSFAFFFNDDISQAPSSIIVSTNKGDFSLAGLGYVDNKVSGELAQSAGSFTDVVVYFAIVNINGVSYRIDFLTTNQDSIHGLE